MFKQTFSTTHRVFSTNTSNRGENLEQLLSSNPLPQQPVFAEQVHGTLVAVVRDTTTKTLPAADGLITNNPDLTLVIRHADCLPIIFWHNSGVFGALHAGRKSTEKGILSNALQILTNQFQITKDLAVWFGPAICEKCFQIDRAADTHFDLRTHNLEQLAKWDNEKTYTVLDSDICTKCQSADFYSYRADGPGFPMNFTSVNAGA